MALMPQILVVDADDRQRRTVAQVLRRVVGAPAVAERLTPSQLVAGYDLIALGYDHLSEGEKEILLHGMPRAEGATRILMLSSGRCRDDFVNLFGSHTMTNLLAWNEGLDDDFLVTLKKLLTGELFGMDKYFAWGVEAETVEINSSTQKDEVLESVRAYAEKIGLSRRFAGAFTNVADEFFTNAVYNAPTDAAGHARYSHLPRTETVVLEPGSEVQLSFCCDGRRVGISSSDPFGSLTQAQVLSYLAKCFRRGPDQIDEKSGGAGLGFYYLFDALSHLVVNIAPGRRTEMIGLIDVSGSYRDFRGKTKSFNIFVQEHGGGVAMHKGRLP